MKKLLIILALCLLPVSVWGVSLIGSGVVASSGETYLVSQNFETATTGYDNGETWVEIGSYIDPVYSTALRGTQSCALGSQSGLGGGYIDSPTIAKNEIWVHLRIRFIVTAFVNSYFLVLMDSSDTELFKIYISEDGSTATRLGSSYSSAGMPTLSANTTYNLWAHFKQGDGSAESDVWVGTSTTRPITADQSRSSGTAIGAVDTLYLKGTSNANGFMVVDQIIVSDTSFSTVDN